MKFKYGNAILGVATVLCLASTVRAEEEAAKIGDWIPGTISGSVTVVSDYSFRGISQTQTDLALQGGITYKPYLGFYIGTWGSTINFSRGATDDSYLEQDFLAGYSGSVDDFSYDVSATFLFYPKESKLNYWEFAAKGAYNFGPATLKGGFMWSPDYFGVCNNAVYPSMGVAVPIPFEYATLVADANVGYTYSDQSLFGTPENDYVDWNMGLNVGLTPNLAVDLRYVDTDTNAVGNASDARFVGGVTLAF